MTLSMALKKEMIKLTRIMREFIFSHGLLTCTYVFKDILSSVAMIRLGPRRISQRINKWDADHQG